VALIQRDLEAIRAMELAATVPADEAPLATPPLPLDPERAAAALATRELSPLGAVESVQTVLRMIDLDRAGEAQPIMPLATISVTEDMATSMRLHALGYGSVYHHEILANGLAPDDLGTMLKQRLRWAQGTIQVLLRENPLFLKGLSLPQRLLYFATMWSYFTGFAALVFFAAPIVFLVLGVLPVSTTAFEFFIRFLPFLVINQILFLVVGRGIPTWRGQQYNLALFPIWIRAVVTGCANVWFGRPLGFVVTEKSRQAVGNVGRLLWPQILVAVLLVLASIVGVIRLITLGEEPLGTGVNLFWVVYDLVILSVLVGAARYRGYRPEGGD
jgi:cellulose synthase (UDP-forming)